MGILVTIVINAFHSAWGPFILSRDINTLEVRDSANRLLINYVRFGLALVLFLSLIGPIMIGYFSEVVLDDYFNLVILISLTFLLRGLGWLYDTAQIVNKSSKFSLFGALIQSAIVFSLLSWSAREFSLHGLVHVVLVAQLVRLLFDWGVSRRWERIFTLDLEALCLIIWGGLAFYFCIVWVNSFSWLESHLYAFLLTLIGGLLINKIFPKWQVEKKES